MITSFRFSLLTIAFVVLSCSPRVATVHADPPTELGVLASAAELGITAESLVVAGLHGHAESVMNAIDAQPQRRTELLLLHQSMDQATQAITSITAEIQSTGANIELQAQLSSAQASLASLQTQVDTKRSELLEIVTEGLPGNSLILLANWRTAATFNVDPQYRVAERSAEQWKSIEGALRAEKRAIRRGTELDPTQATLLTDLRQESEVGAAAARLSAQLATTQAVFDQFNPQNVQD